MKVPFGPVTKFSNGALPSNFSFVEFRVVGLTFAKVPSEIYVDYNYLVSSFIKQIEIV